MTSTFFPNWKIIKKKKKVNLKEVKVELPFWGNTYVLLKVIIFEVWSYVDILTFKAKFPGQGRWCCGLLGWRVGVYSAWKWRDMWHGKGVLWIVLSFCFQVIWCKFEMLNIILVFVPSFLFLRYHSLPKFFLFIFLLPFLLMGNGIWSTNIKKMNVVEMQVLWWISDTMMIDKIKNDHIQLSACSTY